MRISDWSSDVCSSDLFRSTVLTLGFFNPGAEDREDRPAYVWLTTIGGAAITDDPSALTSGEDRGGGSFEDRRADFLTTVTSEERRVGKEGVSTGRSRLPPYSYNKNT